MQQPPSAPPARARLRPSTLPMLDTERGGCAWFLPGDSEYFEDGQDRHRAWVALCKGDESLVNLLNEEDAEGVRWAAEYFALHAPAMDHAPVFEKTRVLLNERFEPVFTEGGTPDAICGNIVFDLKWRHRGYYSQMAAYALMAMDASGMDWAKVYVLYGATQRFEALTFSRPFAWEVINAVLAEIESRAPAICDYCSWCDRRLTCAAFNAPAIAVAKGREDWAMQSYHVSEIAKPEDMALAIQLAAHLRKWCDAVDHFKREWVLKQGIKIPGYTIRQGQGDREITDLNEAARLSGIPVGEFIKACSIGIGALKKVWAAHHVISLAEADREINKKLAPVIRREPTTSVVKEKEPKTTKEKE